MSSALSKILITTALVSMCAGTSYAADAPIPDRSDVGAQMTDMRGSVVNRARPGYDAVGIHAGAFTVYPQASVTGSYDDNIYATDTNTKSDFVTKLASSMFVYSNWSRNALNFNAGVAKSYYNSHSGENRLDWNVGMDGRIDVTRDTQLNGALNYQKLHEDRGDPNSPGASAEPVSYTLLTGSAGISQRFNRMTASITGDYNDYNYDSVVSTTGITIPQDFRNRKEYDESLKVGYDVSPDTNVYVKGTINQRKYDQQPPAVTLNRDSKGYAAVVGSDFRLSNLAQGGVYIGYQAQSYDSATLSDISGLSYGADVEWYATPLTTVTLNADSIVNETVLLASGYLSQSVGLRVDHELLRNVLLNANVGYQNDDYTGISRTDDITSAGFGADYLLNQNFSVNLGYSYTDRNSTAVGADYKRNIIGLTLTGKL